MAEAPSAFSKPPLQSLKAAFELSKASPESPDALIGGGEAPTLPLEGPAHVRKASAKSPPPPTVLIRFSQSECPNGSRTPTAFHLSAQGGAPRATLGIVAKNSTNPERVSSSGTAHTMDSTLSGLAPFLNSGPRVARSSQPWAGRWNAVGVRTVHAVRLWKSYNFASLGKPVRSTIRRKLRAASARKGKRFLHSAALRSK